MHDEFILLKVHFVHDHLPPGEGLSGSFIIALNHSSLNLGIGDVLEPLVNLFPVVEIAIDLLITQNFEEVTGSFLSFGLSLVFSIFETGFQLSNSGQFISMEFMVSSVVLLSFFVLAQSVEASLRNTGVVGNLEVQDIDLSAHQELLVVYVVLPVLDTVEEDVLSLPLLLVSGVFQIAEQQV